MAGGIDQTLATAILTNLSSNSGVGTTVTFTGPSKMKLIQTNGSDSSAGTEITAGGGYSAGGSSVSFASASAGSVSTNAANTTTNMPAVTAMQGMELWSSDGTSKRSFWAPWSGGNITVASGNTFTVASGSLTASLA